MSLLHGAMGWSAVSDCRISWSCLLTFSCDIAQFNFKNPHCEYRKEKNGKFATFSCFSFQLKLQHFKCSESVVSESNHALPGTIDLMYSKVFFKIEIQVFKKMSKQTCMR